jgi:hypothetical protein
MWTVLLSLLALSPLVIAAPTSGTALSTDYDEVSSSWQSIASKGYIVKLKSRGAAFTQDVHSIRTLLGEGEALRYNYAWMHAFSADMSNDVFDKLQTQLGDSIEARTFTFGKRTSQF